MKTQAKDAVALAMDWLAQLRDEDSAEPPPGDGQPAAAPAPPAGNSGHAAPPAPPTGNSGHAAVAPAPPVGNSRHAAVAPVPPPRSPGHAAPPEARPHHRAGMRADVEITERAAIGDELRIPVAWCEMGSCISHHADPAALGEADIRARAIAAGWRVDALGRLACPQCQQSDSWFWTAHPVALWDRDTAVAMTTLMAEAVREIAGARGGAGLEPGAVPGGEPAAVPGPQPAMTRPPGRGRHRGHSAHADRAQ